MVNNIDKYLEIANKNKVKYGLNDEYCALIPMLRIVDGRLYVVVPFVKVEEKVWDKGNDIISEYWSVIDPVSRELIEFNRTSEKSFIVGEVIKNHGDDSINKEISKYVISTKLKYKEYIEKDLKNSSVLSYQQKVEDLVKSLNINGEEIPLGDYFYATSEEEIDNQVDKLIDLIATAKYNSLTKYYDILFTNILDEYVNDKYVNNEKIYLACEMMNTYYPGIDAIDNIFNV